MKKLYLTFSAFILLSNLSAQRILSVQPGTSISIQAETIFSTGGLVLTPAENFLFQENDLNRNTVITHPHVNTAAGRVFKYNVNTNSYSGSVRIYYSDADLNGLDESELTFNVHDNVSWKTFSSSVDLSQKYVETVLSGIELNEIALADAAAALPVTWQSVSALRKNNNIIIQWHTANETDNAYFTVEKSYDQRQWRSIGSAIAAGTSTSGNYEAIDNEYSPEQIYYRIRQTDLDGKFAYSPTAVVYSISSIASIYAYPNPVVNSFSIANISSDKIKQIQVFNLSGVLQHTFTTPKDRYSIQKFPAGVYKLRVMLTNNTFQYITITKL